MDRVHGRDCILTDYAKNLIRFKARQLSKRRDFHPAEWEDLQQELWLALIKVAEQFDPAKASLNTFIDRVVNSKVAMILRARQRHKCGNGHHTQSLDNKHSSKSEQPEPVSSGVSADDLSRRTGAYNRDEAVRREDADAVAHALEQMPEAMRDLCRRRMGGTVTSLSLDLGVSRRQISKALAAARPFLEQAGFGLT